MAWKRSRESLQVRQSRFKSGEPGRRPPLTRALLVGTIVEPMLLLGPDDVRKALPMADAIEAMRSAFACLAEGRAQAPLRTALTAEGGVTLVMPAALTGPGDAAMAVKVVSVFARNKARGVPAIHGIVIVVDPETGKPLATMDGGALETATQIGNAPDGDPDIEADEYLIVPLTSLAPGSTCSASTKLAPAMPCAPVIPAWQQIAEPRPLIRRPRVRQRMP